MTRAIRVARGRQLKKLLHSLAQRQPRFDGLKEYGTTARQINDLSARRGGGEFSFNDCCEFRVKRDLASTEYVLKEERKETTIPGFPI